MRNRGRTHLARSFVVFLGAVLVLAGAGFAAARTMGGAPWTQPLLSAAAACDETTADETTTDGTDESADDPTDGTDETDGTTDGTDETDGTTDGTDETDGTTDGTDETDGTTDGTDETDGTDPADSAECTTEDPEQEAADAEDAQTFFEQFSDECGTAVVGETDLTDPSVDAETVDAYNSLADALDSGQIDHMVQSVRVLLSNCEAHANDGLRNALYHHGLNWLRHYQHELWLEQKFADKWPDGKPGGGPSSDAEHGKPDKPDHTEKAHGNPHDADPSWAPGGGSSSSHGNGNAFGHAK